MSIEFIRLVGAVNDDCARRLTTSYWNLSSAYVVAGYNGETNKRWGSGMRFLNITIPKGSTIDEAHLTVRCLNDYSGTVVNSRISAEDVDNPPAFADDAVAFDARWTDRTSARIEWDAIPAWTADTDYDSPDIKAVIQEIVDREDWASGNAIVIFWEDFDDRSGPDAFAYRDGYSYEEALFPDELPALVINYSEAVTAPTVTTQAATGLGPIAATLNGTLDSDGGESCDCGFEYGETTDYGTETPTGSKTSGETFSQPITGLAPNKTYHFRAIATNSAGTVNGADRSLTTEPALVINRAYALAREEL